MASSNNNTTSLNMGSGGTIGTRNFNDYTANKISAEISTKNYEMRIVSDERLQKFREAVYSMVSSWLLEDKLYMLREYGTAKKLGNNPSEKTINELLTETIITRLDPGTLEQLYNDIMVSQRSIKKDIKEIEKTRKRENKKAVSGFNVKNFEETYDKVKNSKNAKQFNEISSINSRGFKVPRRITNTNRYGQLRKELRDVLRNCYNNLELTGIALSMGIEIPEGTNFKEVSNLIINKTLLYVNLITGRGKNIYSNAYMDPEPYNNLLSMTSWSWVPGKPGLDKGEWKILQDKARRAHQAVKERAKLANMRKHFDGKDFEDVSGVKGGSLRSVSKQLKKNDKGLLANASYDQLVELAAKYGIDPNAFRNRKINVLKAKIYAGMANENKRTKTLEKRINSKKPWMQGYIKRDNQDALNANKDYSYKEILRNNIKTSSKEVPIIHFEVPGTPITEVVPVYIAGISPLLRLGYEIDKDRDKVTPYSVLSSDNIKRYFPDETYTTDKVDNNASASYSVLSSDNIKLSDNTVDKVVPNTISPIPYNNGNVDKSSITSVIPVFVVNMSNIGGDSSLDETASNPLNNTETSSLFNTLKDKQKPRLTLPKKKEHRGRELKVNTENGSITNPKGFSKEAKKGNSIRELFSQPAAPVYLVNNQYLNILDDIETLIANGNEEAHFDISKLMLGLGSYVSAAPMGVGAITSPVLLATGATGVAAGTIAEAAEMAFSPLTDSLGAEKYATGGTIKAKDNLSKSVRHVSRFATGGTTAITGDAPGSNIFAHGAKPELVQSTGDMSITPLNTVSTASKQKSTRMTSTERSQALATGISSHIVKFKFEYTPENLEEVSNVGEAIKVYNVKPGITDSIDINGTQMSLMDLLSAIYVQLGAVTDNGTTGNQLLTAIAAKPVSSGSSSVTSTSLSSGFPSSLDNIAGGN